MAIRDNLDSIDEYSFQKGNVFSKEFENLGADGDGQPELKKKSMNFGRWLVLICVVLVGAAVLLVMGQGKQEKDLIEAAIELYDSGQYEQAYNAFENLLYSGDERVFSHIYQAAYETAQGYLVKGNYSEAYTWFTRCNGFSDSAEMARYAEYHRAYRSIKNNDYRTGLWSYYHVFNYANTEELMRVYLPQYIQSEVDLSDKYSEAYHNGYYLLLLLKNKDIGWADEMYRTYFSDAPEITCYTSDSENSTTPQKIFKHGDSIYFNIRCINSYPRQMSIKYHVYANDRHIGEDEFKELFQPNSEGVVYIDTYLVSDYDNGDIIRIEFFTGEDFHLGNWEVFAIPD